MNYKRNQEELLNSFICPLLSLLAEHNLLLSFWLVCLTSSSGHSGCKVYFPVFLFVSDSCDASIMNDVCMMHVTNWDERTSGRKAKFVERIKRKNAMNISYQTHSPAPFCPRSPPNTTCRCPPPPPPHLPIL